MSRPILANLRLPRLVRTYFVLLQVNWQLLMEYRAGMAIWILANTLPLVMLAVWLTLAASGPVGNYGAEDFTAYYLALLLVRQLTTVWVAWELDHDIRLGELSAKLLRPLNPIHNHIALHLADKLFRLLTVVPLILGVMALVPGLSYPLTPARLLLFAGSLAAALAMRFLSQYCTGLLSFWISHSLAVNDILFAGMLMFGGVIAPLELFPPQMAAWVQWLPFRYMLSLPVEILIGRVQGAALLQGLAVQALWLGAWALLALLFWKSGLRRYGAVGS